MGNRYSGQIKNVYTQLVSPDFIKAKHTSAYLIKWEDVNHAPNYFFSSDLNNYTVLSDVQPQVRYNWLKAELHSYKDSLGKLYQGVLYKPDNFDSSNTYPVIFNIYEEKSNLLNSFPNAAMSFGACSIAFLVSNGYLVFLPNIKKENPKYVGESVLRSVIAAADHLKKFKWIDQNKIGIIGESTGGFETNYIITHTNRFAAAISAAGVSDMISHATMLRYGNAHINSLSGYGYMMGATLPEDPSAYIRNSPILEADQVQTPLLLLHNFGDDAVDYRHSQSFFIVLRSLQKKVWWLNYKNEGHALLNFNDRLDYHTRAYEFWNYFLKNKKEPEWMREHLSAD
jgi:dipeptidyl aminopeptidase/acylaminoacyl peptidase